LFKVITVESLKTCQQLLLR